MQIFRIKTNFKLERMSNKDFPDEEYLQRLVESNLQELFGLEFISGASNKEFVVKGQHQNFYIDTLAFDPQTRSFVIIEYKKDKSFSVIDQGYSYLSAMLNNKADFVLEYFEKLGKPLKREQVDWSQPKIIFVAREFTPYQKGSIGFQDLPIELWEAELSNTALITFNQIKPPETQESITAITRGEGIRKLSKEIKSYTEKDVVGKDPGLWALYLSLKEQINLLADDIDSYATKYYVGFKFKNDWRVPITVNIRVKKLEIHLARSQPKDFKDPKSQVQYLKNSFKYFNQHISYLTISHDKELKYAIFIIKQALEKHNKI